MKSAFLRYEKCASSGGGWTLTIIKEIVERKAVKSLVFWKLFRIFVTVIKDVLRTVGEPESASEIQLSVNPNNHPLKRLVSWQIVML